LCPLKVNSMNQKGNPSRLNTAMTSSPVRVTTHKITHLRDTTQQEAPFPGPLKRH
jgi:hypothetical protein